MLMLRLVAEAASLSTMLTIRKTNFQHQLRGVGANPAPRRDSIQARI